jgi:hypothetical protein
MITNRPSRAQNAEAIANKLQSLRSTEGRYPVRPDISQEAADRAAAVDELRRLLYQARREDVSNKDLATSLYNLADVLSGNLPPDCGPAQ